MAERVPHRFPIILPPVLCQLLAVATLVAAILVALMLAGRADEAAADPAPGTRAYYWTWYDQSSAGARDWVLVSNPVTAAVDLHANISIGGVERDLSQFNGGVVGAGHSITPAFPGVMGGPVIATSLGGERAIASQRTLWAGSSLEEVTGTDWDDLSSHYYWTWYDDASAGYSNWVLVANPNDAPVYYRIKVAGVEYASGFIQPHENVTPRFPGVMGGPVEVEAWADEIGGSTVANVVASQRVLSNGGSAFNEVPGIPAADITSHYYWTWYDRSGGEDWLLLSNPGGVPVYYRIKIAGATPTAGGTGTLQPGQMVTPVFPGAFGGPVEVEAWSDALDGSNPANIIASQRVVWGPSFEETPGIGAGQLGSDYHWTWYDQLSAGAADWVLVANTNAFPVYYDIRVAGTVRASGSIQPGQRVTPAFRGLMGGPVEVRAYSDPGKQTPAHVIASQRVLWSGHFNEVAGMTLGAEAPPAPPVSGLNFPADNVWNTPIDTLPVAPNSDAYVATIGAGDYVHPDFGSGLWDGGPIGIPYVVVSGSQPRVPVSFYYPDESDPGPYPIPPDAPIGGGPGSTGDRHVIVIDSDIRMLYEVYDAHPRPDGGWDAGSGAVWSLDSNTLRPAGWTSADAAGLPIYAGLVKYDEVVSGEIRHAIRFTAPETRAAFIWPARHLASGLTGAQYPPMGQRFRLKAGVDISGYSPEAQVILTAMKRYGIILADNGAPWYIGGAPDERWNNDELHALQNLHGSDFEAVDESSLMVDPDSGAVRTP